MIEKYYSKMDAEDMDAIVNASRRSMIDDFIESMFEEIYECKLRGDECFLFRCYMALNKADIKEIEKVFYKAGFHARIYDRVYVAQAYADYPYHVDYNPLQDKYFRYIIDIRQFERSNFIYKLLNYVRYKLPRL